MVKCTFCGSEVARGTGKIYVKKDGRIFNFCSMKCEKNLLKLERVPREQKWTEAYRRIKEKQPVAEVTKEDINNSSK